jgi:hypothetical protein
MVPIEQKDWTEEDRASKLGQNHPLDSTKRLNLEWSADSALVRIRTQIGHYGTEKCQARKWRWAQRLALEAVRPEADKP